jgi:short-subunit dehydrogenase
MEPAKTAIVTGSASGIGLEMAVILAQKGYNLYLVDVQQPGLEKIKQEIEQAYPVQVITHCIDLSLPQAAQEIWLQCEEKNLDIDVLINNAGFFFFSEVAQANVSRASAMIGLHIHTPSMLAIYFGRKMKEKKRGYILMVSSISAYKDFPGIGFYAASKSYIKSFCRSMRYEMRYYGVQVTTLCPGATATNLYDPNIINVEKGKRWGIMMDAKKVAQAGIRGMFKNKAVVIPGFVTKLMTWFSMLTPNWVIYWARVKWRKFF